MGRIKSNGLKQIFLLPSTFLEQQKTGHFFSLRDICIYRCISFTFYIFFWLFDPAASGATKTFVGKRGRHTTGRMSLFETKKLKHQGKMSPQWEKMLLDLVGRKRLQFFLFQIHYVFSFLSFHVIGRRSLRRHLAAEHASHFLTISRWGKRR